MATKKKPAPKKASKTVKKAAPKPAPKKVAPKKAAKPTPKKVAPQKPAKVVAKKPVEKPANQPGASVTFPETINELFVISDVLRALLYVKLHANVKSQGISVL